MSYNIDKYIDSDGFSPVKCPNCGSKVEITSSRDGNIISTYAQCLNDTTCEGSYFNTDSHIEQSTNSDILQSDFEVVAIKYFDWASSEGVKKGYRLSGEWD